LRVVSAGTSLAFDGSADAVAAYDDDHAQFVVLAKGCPWSERNDAKKAGKKEQYASHKDLRISDDK
jgi:hypothetical protein